MHAKTYYKKAFIAVYVLIAAAFGYWLALVLRSPEDAPPPGPRCSFGEFLMDRARIEALWIFTHNDKRYLEVEGNLPPTITLPSGPPSYIFDNHGKLVDWTYDRDTISIGISSHQATDRRGVSLPEAIEWIHD